MKPYEKRFIVFHKASNAALNKVRFHIDAMPYKGDSQDESQKVFLRIAINRLQAAIDGTTLDDFEGVL